MKETNCDRKEVNAHIFLSFPSCEQSEIHFLASINLDTDMWLRVVKQKGGQSDVWTLMNFVKIPYRSPGEPFRAFSDTVIHIP